MLKCWLRLNSLVPHIYVYKVIMSYDFTLESPCWGNARTLKTKIFRCSHQLYSVVTYFESFLLFEILGSDDGENKDDCLLGCSASGHYLLVTYAVCSYLTYPN